jgi:hypothetical protein
LWGILLFGHVHHVDGKRMLINLHRPLGSFKLQLPLLESQLNLLLEDLALVCIMGRGLVPLAVFHILELFFQRDLVICVGAYQRYHREIAMMPADANWGGRYFINHE